MPRSGMKMLRRRQNYFQVWINLASSCLTCISNSIFDCLFRLFFKWKAVIGMFYFHELGMDSSWWEGKFQFIKVNYNVFQLGDKKKGNRHLDKPMDSQISRWKDNLFLISLSFPVFFRFVCISCQLKCVIERIEVYYLSPTFSNTIHFVAKVNKMLSYIIPYWLVFASYRHFIFVYFVGTRNNLARLCWECRGIA